MEKIIRIQAICDAFEIDEQIEEKRCVKRLTQIRNMFERRKIQTFFGKKTYNGTDRLKVTTSVVNPRLL